MTRYPPKRVRRILRDEIGFGCPANGCGNPYLYYHHFDPPWSKRHHHDPGGMIALCAEHHAKADAGAYTVDQLRAMKGQRVENVNGRFDWRRRELLAVIGGNIYYETPKMVVFRGEPLIWYARDDDGYLSLSARMVSRSRIPRLQLDSNDWALAGRPQEFDCPPSGRLIRAKYANGDELNIEFTDLPSPAEAAGRFAHFGDAVWTRYAFPITAVEIQASVGGTDNRFGTTSTHWGGSVMTGCVIERCAGGGLSIG